VLSSDTLYSAVTLAMQSLGWLDPWLAATASAPSEPAVALSSLFPAQEESLLAPPPAHLWPAPSTRLRAGGARLIPTSLIRALAHGEGWNEDHWEVDALSECLLRRGRRRAPGAPFRFALRRHAAVDRLDQGRVALHETACVEFAGGAGLWCVARFAGAEASHQWVPRLQSAFRLLADTGLGGERRPGWGRFTIDRTGQGELPELIWGRHRPATVAEASGEAAPASAPASGIEERGWWLLSLFSPAETDAIDWSRGSFSMVERGGRVNSNGAAKLHSRMVREGSLLIGAAEPRGRAWNVAPPGFDAHPVWRAGFAVAVEMPWRVPAS
jgi:CRISPR/Cas system CSM-associated protein Csm4 (group 5 of RAMP superfamily)